MGEPLIQAETPHLVSGLLHEGYTVLMETNGSLDISVVDPRCVRIVDMKCPSSGQADTNDLSNLKRLSDRDEIKFVIGSQNDYEFAREVSTDGCEPPRVKATSCFRPFLISYLPRTLVEWIWRIICDVRFQLQLHKYIWDPYQRGV